MDWPLPSPGVCILLVLEIPQGVYVALGERSYTLPWTNPRLLHLADNLYDCTKPDLCLDGSIIELWFQ